jgi:hypothetical protein
MKNHVKTFISGMAVVVALYGRKPGIAAIAVRADSVEDRIMKPLNRIVITTVIAAVRRKLLLFPIFEINIFSSRDFISL